MSNSAGGLFDVDGLGRFARLLEGRLAFVEGRLRTLWGLGRWETGDIKWTGRAAPSTGWLAADGSVVSQATYAALYAEIGATFNVGGEGVGNFRLPDLRGRAAIGAGTGTGLTLRTLGGLVGAETHQLTIAELAAHNHGGSTGAINSSSASTNPAMDFSAAGGSRRVDLPADASGTSNFYNAHTHSISSQGGGGAHNNMQPSLVLNAFIKT